MGYETTNQNPFKTIFCVLNLFDFRFPRMDGKPAKPVAPEVREALRVNRLGPVSVG